MHVSFYFHFCIQYVKLKQQFSKEKNVLSLKQVRSGYICMILHGQASRSIRQ